METQTRAALNFGSLSGDWISLHHICLLVFWEGLSSERVYQHRVLLHDQRRPDLQERRGYWSLHGDEGIKLTGNVRQQLWHPIRSHSLRPALQPHARYSDCPNHRCYYDWHFRRAERRDLDHQRTNNNQLHCMWEDQRRDRKRRR